MKEKRIPTRQNQSVEIGIFPADALGPALVMFIIFTTLGSANIGIMVSAICLYFSKGLKDKGRGFMKHYLWSKGYTLKIASRAIPNSKVRQYHR
ncbi:type IV conjugative transfer system protein TraL [Pseudoalteromonas sp. T1lg23B]|uniref:type IV conjugative transfer system protein TraL n=1 Tax=Pseudoalteromonas sp. T1lg23B TaxID=2077097 RepID=UPI000CF74E26